MQGGRILKEENLLGGDSFRDIEKKKSEQCII